MKQRHARQLIGTAVLGSAMLAAPAAAGDARPYIGLDLGISQAANDNYSAHVQTGGAVEPYFGYMFNKYIGVQGQIHFTIHPSDDDGRGFKDESDITSLFGATAGPRLTIPLSDAFDLFGVMQGGVFTGMTGRIEHTAPGFSTGGGIDYHLTRNVTMSAFGRFNRAFTAPRPTFLGPPVTGGPTQASEDQGPEDARWVTAGLGIQYDFHSAPPPPPPAPPIAQAPPPMPPVKKKIVLRSVHFDFDKADIRPDARPVLDEAVRILTEEGGIAVIVEGHTDSLGKDAYNMKLSQRRAQAVHDYLVNGGIAASRITTEGYGESKPVATNDTEDGRAQNRRVELRIK